MSAQKRPTLQMIADMAGVSKMTVSRVLRKHPNCSPKTRERVEKAALELNYKKHPLVAALMSSLRYNSEPDYKPTIALLHFRKKTNHPHPNLINLRQGALESADMQGYSVEEFFLEGNGMTVGRMIQILRTRGIRGIIFEHSQQPNLQLDVDLNELACVTTKYSLAHPVLHRVETSQFSSLLMVFKQLKDYGYRRFGLVLPGCTEDISQYRRSAATLYAQNAINENDRIPTLNLPEDDNVQLQQWIEDYQPEVILSQSLTTYDLLIGMGFKVPDDLGFVHLELSNRNGFFAGVDTNWAVMGRIAANQVIDQLNRNETGVPNHPVVTLVQGDWVDGETFPNRRVITV